MINSKMGGIILNQKLKRIILFFTLCIMITGGVFFVKNYHDNNIDKTYISYVENTLIPKLENGRNLNIDSKKLLEKDAEGILFYRIINLDKDKKLLVGKIKIDYDAYSKGSIETSLIYDLYSINNKNIKKLDFGKTIFLDNNKVDLTNNMTKYYSKIKNMNLFITKNKSSNYFCFNYTSMLKLEKNNHNDIYFFLKTYKQNNSSMDLKLNLAPYIMNINPTETVYKITLFEEGGALTFKNKTDLKNKCISDSKKYALDNLIENMFKNAENKSFTDISKLNNIDKIINITVK